MPETIHLPLLDQIRIASPCPARWEDMVGNEQVRHCAQCDLDVHNITAMTRDQAEAVLARLAEGRVCARFFRRLDGTILTRDCPVGLAAARAKLLKAVSRCAAAVGLAVLASAAAKASQDTRWGNYGWSMRLNNAPPVMWACEQVNQIWYRFFPSNAVRFGWGGGIIMGPPGEPPPVKGVAGNYGPKRWEYKGPSR